MMHCKNCGIADMTMLICPNCGANICTTCANATDRICPYCYSTLDFPV